MRRTIDPRRYPLPDVADQASAVASETADGAGVRLVELDDLASIQGTSRLFGEIWGTSSEDAQLSPDVLRALVHAGNYAQGALLDGVLVGAVVGFFGRDDEGLYLHSHILGVSKHARGRHVGLALKQQQRAWALDRGLRKITWTFDPLVRRNAYFNMQKLGAEADGYYEHFYGAMADGINAGDESDRVLVVWRLDSSRALDAADGRLDEPSTHAAAQILSSDGNESPAASLDGGALTCSTPEDIVTLRRTDPDAALRWRRALRVTLGRAMHDGYVVAGITRAGSYVLNRDGASD